MFISGELKWLTPKPHSSCGQTLWEHTNWSYVYLEVKFIFMKGPNDNTQRRERSRFESWWRDSSCWGFFQVDVFTLSWLSKHHQGTHKCLRDCFHKTSIRISWHCCNFENVIFIAINITITNIIITMSSICTITVAGLLISQSKLNRGKSSTSPSTTSGK